MITEPKFGIEFGMSKEQALEKFIDWQQNKKTCQRCEGEKYVQYCPIHLICKEAQDVNGNAQGNGNGTGTPQINEPETIRINLSEAKKRASIR
jgi:hypothetical protein